MRVVRVGQSEHGTFGVLVDEQIPFAVTLELPWRDNNPFTSCIPSGTYTCVRQHSPKFGETFEVTGVPDREHILFHRGNAIPDTSGCILVAEEFTVLNGQPAIGRSAPGFDEFLRKLDGRPSFQLTIIEAFHRPGGG